MTRVYLGLGSNIGDRARNLAFARRRLAENGLQIVAASVEENTSPVGGVEQPDFLNQVLEADTVLAPGELLEVAKGIEAEAGRRESGVRWGPRELDIDILLYEGAALDTDELTLPHPGVVDRPYLQRELAEVAPALMADAVILVAHDPRWSEQFAAEAARLRQRLGEVALQVDHVGSTSVPGLTAKAIIDIQLSVPEVGDAGSYMEPLQQLGYDYVPDVRFPTYPFFRYPARGPRAFHLHVAQAGSTEERDHLEFRDRLRADPEIARLYGELKRELARRFFADRVTYSNSKGDFVQSVLAIEDAQDASQ